LHYDGFSDRDKDYHVADGGYADNEGMATVIEWINYLLNNAKDNAKTKLNFDRILVIRILPFPTSELKAAEINRGWLYAFLGPAKTIGNVRTASQADRNRVALELLIESSAVKSLSGKPPDKKAVDLINQLEKARTRTKLLRAEAITMDEQPEKQQVRAQDLTDLTQEVKTTRSELLEHAEISWTAFVCLTDHTAPLSWKLTEKQKADIDCAWERIKNDDQHIIPPGLEDPPLKTLDHFFPRKSRNGS
jgi:hypothetical protein